jgi:hypothetical protein
MTIHKFKDSYREAQQREKTVLKWLKARYEDNPNVSIRNTNKTEQRTMGIDFVMTEGDSVTYLELKSDHWTQRTGNVVCEWSVNTKAPNRLYAERIKDGWTVGCQAHKLLYWVIGQGIYVFDWTKVKQTWLEMGNKAQRKHINNGHYYGIVSLFPLENIKPYSDYFVSEISVI